jgi:putative permease
MHYLRSWVRDTLADPQVVTLAGLLALGFGGLMVAGDTLAPVIASVVLAYLLEGAVGRLQRAGLPRLAAVVVVFVLFLAVLVGIFFVLIPLLVGQLSQLAQQLPHMLGTLRNQLLQLPTLYPDLLGDQHASELVERLRVELVALGQRFLAYSVKLLPTVMTLAVYLVLVPLLVFFFLKDRDAILRWCLNFLPRERPLADQVWREVNIRVGGYVRGKLYEIIIVAIVTYAGFLWLSLDYSALLATVAGISVLIPYIGALFAAAPVVVVALFQWGMGDQVLWALGVYTIIQVLDGNLVAPLLLSETVKLHPIAVIVAILVFGGIWGFWGVFFAVPLASLVQVVVKLWPQRRRAAGP